MDKKTNRKSASKWDQSGERALIEIWGDKMKQLRGCRKNSHILIEMASELEAIGYKYTPEELKTKMHNMTNRYKKEKINIGSTGGSPSEWDLYKEMQNLLAPFKSYHTEDLVADSIKNINSGIPVISLLPPSAPATDVSPAFSSPSTGPPLSPSPSPSSPKLRTSEKKKKNDKTIQTLQKTFEHIKNTTEKVVAIEEEKKEILKKFAEKEAEVQDALLEFLKRN